MSFIQNWLSSGSGSQQTSAAPAQQSSPANSDLLSTMGSAVLGPVLGPSLGLLPSLFGGGSSGSGPSFPSGGAGREEAVAPPADATEEEVQQYVSLIVRGKNGPDHHPGVMSQHADVIRADGAPAGFFGEGGGPLGNIGLNMDGVVADEDWFGANRPGYIDGDIAADQGLTSTVLQIPVTPEQALAFDQYWEDLAADPGKFNILGDNCSTHAAEAFAAAGLLDGGIDGLDTPDHLYEQLLELHPDAVSESGFLDFDHTGDTWTHSVTPNGSPVAYPDGSLDSSIGQSSLGSSEHTVPSSANSSGSSSSR